MLKQPAGATAHRYGGAPVRVVGYIRESADPSDGRSAFSQQEELRRHAGEQGHLLVAICQDLRNPGQPSRRDGYLSLLGVIAAGGVDAVLVPGVATFSPDAIVQEIMLWDLKHRGARVVSTVRTDMSLLDPHVAPEPSRVLIRDVLHRVAEHTNGIKPQRDSQLADQELPERDVLVHIVHADADDPAPVVQDDRR